MGGEAVKEAERAVKELGAVGVYMRPNFVNGRTLHSGYYHPLWSTLQELDVPVGFHEGTGFGSTTRMARSSATTG